MDFLLKNSLTPLPPPSPPSLLSNIFFRFRFFANLLKFHLLPPLSSASPLTHTHTHTNRFGFFANLSKQITYTPPISLPPKNQIWILCQCAQKIHLHRPSPNAHFSDLNSLPICQNIHLLTHPPPPPPQKKKIMIHRLFVQTGKMLIRLCGCKLKNHKVSGNLFAVAIRYSGFLLAQLHLK